MFLSSREGGGTGRPALSRCCKRLSLQQCTNADTATWIPGSRAWLLMLQRATSPRDRGTSSPLRLRGYKRCCSPLQNFNTRTSSVPASPSLLRASPRGVAAHTKAGRKKGDLPRGKPALPSYKPLLCPGRTCRLPSLLPPPLCPCPCTEVAWPHCWY